MKSHILSPCSIAINPETMALREIRSKTFPSHRLTPQFYTRECYGLSPCLGGKDRRIATNTAWENCRATVRATNQRKKSPTTMPCTPPSGLLSAESRSPGGDHWSSRRSYCGPSEGGLSTPSTRGPQDGLQITRRAQLGKLWLTCDVNRCSPNFQFLFFNFFGVTKIKERRIGHAQKEGAPCPLLTRPGNVVTSRLFHACGRGGATMTPLPSLLHTPTWRPNAASTPARPAFSSVALPLALEP